MTNADFDSPPEYHRAMLVPEGTDPTLVRELLALTLRSVRGLDAQHFTQRSLHALIERTTNALDLSHRAACQVLGVALTGRPAQTLRDVASTMLQLGKEATLTRLRTAHLMITDVASA